MKVKTDKRNGKLMITFNPETQTDAFGLGRFISGRYSPREAVIIESSTGEVESVSVSFRDLCDCCVFEPSQTPLESRK